MSCQHVITQYRLPCDVRQVEPLGGHGGFSGAALWKLATSEGPLCLRRWPRPHPTRDQLRWIHNTLMTVRETGFGILPAYYKTSTNDTILDFDDHLWELTDWLPGAALNSQDIRDDQLATAMQSLAEFHSAAVKTNTCEKNGCSPAAKWRWDRFRQLNQKDLDKLADRGASQAALPTHVVNELVEGFQRLSPHARNVLAKAATLATPLQPCLRDIWYEHVLFDGDTVTGLVDFGAMRTDSVAVDVARLLGSYAGAQQSRWHLGLRAYEAVRRLSDDERQLAEAMDLANALMAGLQWISWICLEGRRFEDMARVARRMAEIRDRLAALSQDIL